MGEQIIKLRPYQQKSVDKVLQHFRREKSPAVIVLPTGAGKSIVIAELARLARGRVLVLAHVKELVEQNYNKFLSLKIQSEVEAGLFSAGLNKKETTQKVLFGSIQSVARADESFFEDFSLLIIDECHRVGMDEDTQYFHVIHNLQAKNPNLCILGLTATPYRLGLGWIYQWHVPKKRERTAEERFFKKCVYELEIKTLIQQGFLTPPVMVDAPVACYDFSSLKIKEESYSSSEIESLLKDQKRITPVIIKNIIELSENKNGVMVFTSSVNHAREILKLLPPFISALVTGETSLDERDEIINSLKNKKKKYLFFFFFAYDWI
jgi:DNA repair protein RadD